MPHIDTMIQRAMRVMAHSYSPYSAFAVGACIKTSNADYFAGTNIENGAYGLCQCAESVAIGQMICAGQKQIDELLVLAHDNRPCPPCGACRQRIFEFSTQETQIHLANQSGVLVSFSIDELLPTAFKFNTKS